jgi:hypothetical protein
MVGNNPFDLVAGPHDHRAALVQMSWWQCHDPLLAGGR